MTEKKAMSSGERAKLIKSVVAAAALSAGTGAALKALGDRKRVKRLDVENSRNAIVVPIKKSKFLEGLPTPEALAASRVGETGQQAKIPMADGSSLLEAPQNDAVDVDAVKRDILKERARKIDFFGKRASEDVDEKKDSGKEREDSDRGESDDKSDVVRNDGEKYDSDSDKGERVVLRDQSGRFVSPNDPVAVAECEKSAGIWDLVSGAAKTVVSPVESFNVAMGAATDKPVWLAAGTIGSIYLAKLIADEVNSIRKRKAQERVENGRDEYVSLLQSPEKSASVKEAKSGDIRAQAGTIMGTAFFVPMALAALVTNRVIENRRAERKAQSEKSRQYPDEPVILYKTSSDRTIEISPETALAAIAVKRGMILASEGFCGEEKTAASDNEKSAGLSLFYGPDIGIDDARDKVVTMMERPENNQYLLQAVKAMQSGDSAGVDAAFKGMSNGEDEFDMKRIYGHILKDPAKKRQLMDSVKTSKRVQDLIVSRFQDDKYADSFGKYRNELVNSKLGETFKKDSMLYRIISWIAENLGLGKYMAKGYLNRQFKGWGDDAKRNAASSGSGKPNVDLRLATGRLERAASKAVSGVNDYLKQKWSDASGYVSGKISKAYNRSKLREALNAPGGPVGWWYAKNHPEMFVRLNPVKSSGRFVSDPDGLVSDEEISRNLKGRDGM